jgi:hypothetical protein
MRDDRFPARNRTQSPLPFMRLEVEHGDGIEVYDPNGMIGAGLNDAWRSLSPVADRVSILSGAPAVIYRADDLEIPLSPEELRRFALHALAPREYRKLRDVFGMAFEWHDDFYDATSGGALQPAMRNLVLLFPEDDRFLVFRL